MSVARLMQMAAAGSAGAGPEPSGWTDPDLATASYDSVSFSVAGQDGVPMGVFFKPDGTKLYVTGEGSDSVYEYDASTAWDVSSASYVQSFSVSGQDASPQGLFFHPDGTTMYVVGITNDSIYEYALSTAWDISTASLSNTLDISTEDTAPRGLFFSADGSRLYVAGDAGNDIKQYSLSTAWDTSTASYVQNFSVSSQDANIQDVFLSPDGTKMFVVGLQNDSVYQYSLSTAFDLSTASYDSVSFSVASQDGAPTALTFKSDGSKMYALGIATDTIYQYSTAAAAPSEWTDPDLANASYDSVSFSVAGEETAPNAMFFGSVGTKLYVTGSSGDDVNEYDLSSAWDVSSASYVQNFSVSTQDTAPTGLFFKDDGSKMYVVGASGDAVNEYDLSSAWDISTASYSQNFSVSAQDTIPRDLFFKPDGLEMYIVGLSGVDINQYTLSAAWDISTASYSQNFSVSAQEATPTSLFLSPNGDKLFLLGISGDDVNEYNLSTAWDISSASYVQNFSVSAQETAPTGIFFKSDGSKMYIVGSGSDTIYQYSTA